MHYVGIDIGGTSIKAGLVDESGSLLESCKMPTPSEDLEALVKAIEDLITGLKTKVKAVGVGIPGLRSLRTRVIQTSPNIPCLRNVNLEDALQGKLGLPVITENDANAGAYGEWACGAGKSLRHMVYITLGTGLGSGIVLSGKLFQGASGYAGELGHTVVEPDGRPCACGSRGCLETRVSAPGIVRTAQELHYGEEAPTAESIYEAAIRGDRAARAAFEETGRFLGMACSNIMNLLNPESIVIGGGVMASGDLLLEAAREEARRRAFSASALDCPIVQSQLWPNAGIIGAAMLARDTS